MSIVTHQRQKGYCGKIYPYGGFSLGYDSCSDLKRNQKRSRDYDKLWCDFSVPVEFDSEPTVLLQLEGCDADVPFLEERKKDGYRKLSLVNAHYFSQKRKRKGLKGISTHGRHMIKSCGYLLQERLGRKNLAFHTVTMPSMPDIYRIWLNSNWGEFVRRYFQKIRRECRRRGACDQIVSCTEIQEKRLKDSGELYLHLHYIVQARASDRQWVLGADFVRGAVRDAVCEVLRQYPQYEPFGRDWNEREVYWHRAIDLQVVKKDAVSYLAKYLSKGSVTLQEAVNMGGLELELPHQWWYCTSSLKKVAKMQTVRLNSIRGQEFLALLGTWSCQGLVRYLNTFPIRITSDFSIDCWYGCVSPTIAKRYQRLRQAKGAKYGLF